MNVHQERRRLQREQDERLRRLHNQGLSREDQSADLGVSVRTVIRWAKRLKLTRGAK